MHYDLLIFDLDGTLSDPGTGIARSINYALARHGYEVRPESELVRYIGPPIDRIFAAITGSSEVSEISALVGTYRKRYGAVGYAENTICEGVPQALEQLAGAGARLGVCTSKRQDFAEKILEMFGIRKYFLFVDGGDIGINKWQQMEGLVREGVVTRNSVMIGDRGVDLVAAHRNGLSSAGVLWGYGSGEELRRENPRHLLDSPAALLLLLDGPV